MNLIDRIFNISTDAEFEDLALEIFAVQYRNNPIYRSFVDALGTQKPNNIVEIPFLPIEFFKNHNVIQDSLIPQIIFKSSGTGGERSRHLVADLSIYERSFLSSFTNFFGSPKESIILALLPNYLEQGESSLVYMVNELIKQSKDPRSGFFLENTRELIELINQLKTENKQIILFGVSYSLLDIAELNPDFSGVTIIETGGMKGRRKEMSKESLHKVLKKGLNVGKLYSEYGMTELLSQAYSLEDLTFRSPKWMKILIRDTNDPFSYNLDGRTGGINVIDLANIYSCPFIATQDLGRINSKGFEVLGRFDQADIRGCNLLVQ